MYPGHGHHPYQREQEEQQPRLKKGTACRACRLRKTKCNAARPTCSGCVARSSQCAYDIDVSGGPRRSRIRGPVKIKPHGHSPSFTVAKLPSESPLSTPNTRSTTAVSGAGPSTSGPSSRSAQYSNSPVPQIAKIADSPKLASPCVSETLSAIEPADDQTPSSSRSLIKTDKQKDPENDQHVLPHRATRPFRVASGDFALRDGVVIWNDGPEITFGPSLDFHRKTWWDRLLSVYSPHGPNASYLLIIEDLKYLVRINDPVLSFLHIPSFFRTFLDPVKRHAMQPSIVLAMLALSMFMQSSDAEAGRGIAGREKALLLQSAAQAALESSINAQWLEPSLAQAALIIALFESSPHPHGSDERLISSLRMLDAIIRTLGLLYADVELEGASVFPEGIAPILLPDAISMVKNEDDQSFTMQAHTQTCSCVELCQTQMTPQYFPTGTSGNMDVGASGSSTGALWLGTAPWNDNWSEDMIRREQNRRVCWSSLQVVSRHVVYQSALGQPLSQYFVTQPSNFALLFPGEAFLPSSVGKTTVWALYDRIMLLWCACAAMNVRRQMITDSDQASFAVQVYTEVKRIEAALDTHTCGTEQAMRWAGRYFLQFARMSATYDFQRWVPSPISGEESTQRRESGEWIQFLQTAALNTRDMRKTDTKHPAIHRPFMIWYFIRQLSKSIRLWELDPTLMDVYEYGRMVMAAIRSMMTLFPSPWVTKVYRDLEIRFDAACIAYGISSYSLEYRAQ